VLPEPPATLATPPPFRLIGKRTLTTSTTTGSLCAPNPAGVCTARCGTATSRRTKDPTTDRAIQMHGAHRLYLHYSDSDLSPIARSCWPSITRLYVNRAISSAIDLGIR